jgi:general secretion pathway protein G
MRSRKYEVPLQPQGFLQGDEPEGAKRIREEEHHITGTTHILREGTKMKKIMKKRSGFTLVELLIVIIIIGILAGAMLMLVGSGTDRAEATKIISDLRSMKAAALMYYADGKNAPDTDGVGPNGLGKYMDKQLNATDYTFAKGSDSDRWFVGRTGVGGTGVREALVKSAVEAGLLLDTTSNDVNPYASGDDVYMRAR